MKYGLKQEVITAICGVFEKHSEVLKVVLYGSRVKGSFRPNSDIDLSLIGERVDLSTQLAVESELDDLLLPYKTDISIYNKIVNEELKDHIDRRGVVLYSAAFSD